MTANEPDDDRASRSPHVVFGVFVGIVVMSLTWPGAVLLGGSEPRILGLPFSLAWIVMCVIAMLVALWIYDRCVGDEGER